MFKLLSALLMFSLSVQSFAGLSKIRGDNVAQLSDIPGGTDYTKLIQDYQIGSGGLGEILSVALANRDIVGQTFGTNIQLAEQKAENEHYGVLTDPLDYSLSNGFVGTELGPYATPSDSSVDGSSFGFLMANYTAGATTMYLAWNPMCLVATTGLCSDSTEKGKTEVTTGWATAGAGGSLALNSSLYVLGVKSLSFAKTTGNTNAEIVKDLGSGTGINIVNNTDLWFAVHLPATTGISDIETTIDIDGTNTCTFTASTDYAGHAFAIGWNWINVNLAGTCGSTGGSGWSPSQTFRYFHVGIDTASSSTTVSPILIDAILFGSPNPSNFFAPGDELGISGATYSKFTFDASNTKFAGPVTIAHPPVVNFGADNTYVNYLDRGLFNVAGDNAARPNTTLTNIESYYQKRTLKSSVSAGKLTISANVVTPIVLSVLTVPTTSQITVEDPTNFSGVISSGTLMDVFQVIKKQNNQVDYVPRGIALQISSSMNSSSITTINSSNLNTGIAIGDVVVFRHAAANYSLVAKQANESFTAAPFLEAIGFSSGIPYPNFSNVVAHWTLSGPNGYKNLVGTAGDLSIAGSLTTNFPFKNNTFSTTGWSGSNFYNALAADNILGGGNNINVMSVSLWYYPTAFSAGASIYSNYKGTAAGWLIDQISSDGTVSVVTAGATTMSTGSGALNLNAWNHIVVNINAGVSGGSSIYVNGVFATSGTMNAANATGTHTLIGRDETGGSGDNLNANDAVADIITWIGSTLTASQVSQLYNHGLAGTVGNSGGFKYRWFHSGLSGQQLSTRIDWTDNSDGFMTQQSATLQ